MAATMKIENLSEDQIKEMGADPFIFNNSGIVEFADGDKEKSSIKLTLYDGSVVPHWYWGNLAFELSSMRMAKKKNPILYSHDVDQRIAISKSASFDEEFVMEGEFLKTSEIAQQVKAQMDEGFPFEASLHFDPAKSKIEYIDEGQSIEVNGNKLKGPGTVVRNAVIIEGSVLVFGALKNTASKAFQMAKFLNDYNERYLKMAKETEMTIEKLTAENLKENLPEIYSKTFAAGKAEGEKAERQMFAELQKVCGDDNELLVACYAEGKTTAEALQMRAEKAESRNKELTEQLAKKATATTKPVDPAIQEFSDKAIEPGKERQKKFADNEEGWKAEFEAEPEIREEFGQVEYYVNFKKAESKGQVKVLGGK